MKVMTNLDSILKSRDITLPTKVHLVEAMVFPVVMYGCESWTVKKAEHGRINAFELWCWRRLLRVTWTARRSNQSILKDRVFIGRTDAEAETPILWPPDVQSWLIWKDPDAGKDCGQEEKGMREDEMVGWHHRFSGHGFGWTPGVGDGQGGLACCSSWGRKDWVNWTELNKDLPGGSDSKSVCLQCGRPEFDPWVRKILWRTKWQPTPVLLHGKSHGQRSLVGYSPWVTKSQIRLSHFTSLHW